MLKRPKLRIRYGLLMAAWSAIALTILCLVPASRPVTAGRVSRELATQDETASAVSGEGDEPAPGARQTEADNGGFFLPIDMMVPGRRDAQRPEGDGEEEEDESGLIEERIRLYKRRHGQSTPERKLKLVRDEYRKREREKRQLAENAQLEAATTWVSAGPTNGGGRLSCVAVHPTATGTLYVGADGGGVWKTTDGGNTWANLTDSLNNLNVGAIGIAPSSPNVVYVGTGSEHDEGIGLLKSTDGGNTWVLPSSVIGDRFFQISVHPNNANELVIATTQGAFRSTDGGANWANVIPQSSYGDITDLVRDPSNPQILYAATHCFFSCSTTVLKSFDGGVNWVNKGSGLPVTNSTQSVLTMKLAISPSSPSILYLSTSISDSLAGNNLSHIYKTTNGGDSWVDLPGIYGSSDPSVNDFLRQTHHDNTIVVSPTNPNVVIAAGVSYVRTTDGGNTWSRPPLQPDFKAIYGVHPDATDLRYQGSVLYIANDGGIFKTPDNGNTASVLNNNLVVREYYALFSDLANANRTFAGSQDNGTDRRSAAGGTSWANVFGGDGFDSATNPQTPSTAYFTYQLGGVVRTRNADDTDPFIDNIMPPYGQNEFAPFATPLIMDLNAPSTLYTSSYRVWKTTNGGDSWTPLPTTTTDGSTWSTNTPVYKIAVARSNSSILMAVKGGDVVFRSTNGGASWFAATDGLPTSPFINALEIDPRNPNIAYVALYDFSAPGRTVYMTTNGGASWVPRGSGLPDAPSVALSVRVDPLDSNTLYCGTSAGVYRSTDQGANWSKFGLGLPSINVEDMRVAEDGSILRIATYGRGIWEVQLRTSQTHTLIVASSNPASGVNVNVTPNDNGGLGSGTTQFTRTYNSNASVTLTAPATAGGNNFQKWQRNGADFANTQAVNVTMDADYTLTAVYSTVSSGNAVYDPTLKAPKCGQPGSACDSGTLLNGRDTISGGQEPNQPNTIFNSCADNTSGSYHADESIDRVKISTLDGGSFAPGKTVKIEVTVWAFSATHDYLDLFHAPDASNPNWTYINTLRPSASGAQVLSTTYVLPSGGDLQAIRANFLYDGSATPCSGGAGNFEDHDDLIFYAPSVATRTLTVASSNPTSGVNVTVSPSDNGGLGGGTTQFTRTYNNNTSVSLTAPSTAGGNSFQKWQRDGADWSTNLTATVTMDANHTMTAVYTGAVGTSGLQYYPLPRPIRLLDTRAGEPACNTPGTPIGANTSRKQIATGTCGGLNIPPTAKAVVGNAAVVNTLSNSGAGFLTLYPSGVARPVAANVNYVPGQIVSNGFTVALGADGAFDIYAYSSLHAVIDITGYYAPPGQGGLYYHPLPKPVRLLDTRIGQPACDAPGAPIQGNSSRNESARTTCGGVVLPNDAQAIVGNAAVVNTLSNSGAGYVTLYPGGVARPVSANVNYTPGQIVSNAFTVGLGSDGTFNIYAYTSLHVVVDVTGYYSASAAADSNGVAGLLYYPLATPMRLLDTRAGQPACVNPGAPLAGNAVRTQNARLTCGALTVPASALAVVGNAAVVNTLNGSGAGHVILYPSGVARPVSANVNYTPGQIVSNAFTVRLGTDGAFNIYAYSSLHFVTDIAGYFAP